MIRYDHHWFLYVDESGDFDDPTKDTCVVGVLVRADVPGSRGDELTWALKQAFPTVPWPPHAALINVVASHVVWCVAAGGNLDGETARAKMLLECAKPAEWQAAVAAAERRCEPAYRDLRELNHALRDADGTLFDRLTQFVRDARTEVAAAFRWFKEHAPEAAFLVAASESRLRQTSGTNAANVDARYRAQLACLLRRTRDVIARTPGRHRVGVWVLSRNTWDPALDRCRRLSVRDVGHVIRDAIGIDANDSTRMHADGVCDFDEQVSGMFVLADFAANGSLGPLADRSKPLASVENWLKQRVKLHVRSGNPTRSHLAAVVGNHDNQSPTPSEKRWALEQAAEWR